MSPLRRYLRARAALRNTASPTTFVHPWNHDHELPCSWLGLKLEKECVGITPRYGAHLLLRMDGYPDTASVTQGHNVVGSVVLRRLIFDYSCLANRPTLRNYSD